MTRRFVLTALAVTLLPTLALAATYKVPGDYTTIQAAVDNAVFGDVIQVSGGPYNENVFLNNKNNLTLAGKNVMIDPGGNDICIPVAGGSDITISGFRLWNPGKECFLAENVDGLVITKCQIVNSAIQGLRTFECADVLITKCDLHSNTQEAIRDDGSNGYRVEKCVIAGSGGGIYLSPYNGGPTGTGDSLIVKNKITDLSAIGSGVILGGFDSIIAKNTLDDINESGIEVSASNVTTNCRIEKNKLSNINGTAIRLYGDDCVAIKNKIIGVLVGLRSQGNNDDMTGNSMKAAGQGIVCTSAGATLTKNKYAGPGDMGYVIDATNCRLVGNKAAGATMFGFFLMQDGNTLIGNKAKRNQGADLRDPGGPGGNTYDGNKFGDEDYSPL